MRRTLTLGWARNNRRRADDPPRPTRQIPTAKHANLRCPRRPSGTPLGHTCGEKGHPVVGSVLEAVVVSAAVFTERPVAVRRPTR